MGRAMLGAVLGLAAGCATPGPSSGTAPGAVPENAVVLPGRLATTLTDERAAGPRDLPEPGAQSRAWPGAESPCVLYRAKQALGTFDAEGRSVYAHFTAATRVERAAGGAAGGGGPQPVVFRRPEGLADRCAIRHSRPGDRHAVAYRIGRTWYYAQTGEPVP